MVLHTHGKAEKYIKNNTLKLNDYLKKNASSHAMKGAVKASLWQDNWQKQKAKTTVETVRNNPKSSPKKDTVAKKESSKRLDKERPDSRDQKKPKNDAKKETGKAESKETKSDTTKPKGSNAKGEPKNDMIPKKSAEASDLMDAVLTLDATADKGDNSNILIQKDTESENNDNILEASALFETDLTQNGEKENHSDEPTWEFFQKQADQDTVQDTDTSDSEDLLDPALLNQNTGKTPVMEKTKQADTTQSKANAETVTIQNVVKSGEDTQKKTDNTLKTDDKSSTTITAKGDDTTNKEGVKANKIENPEKIVSKDTVKIKAVDKSMENTKTGEKINTDTTRKNLDLVQVRDTLNTARTVQQKVTDTPESVDMNDLEKLVSELRKLEEKTSTEKRLEKATLEAAGIRRSLENKMLEKQAVVTMMMERNAMENAQRMREFTKASAPAQNDATPQPATTPTHPMMAPVAPPLTRGSTSLSSGLEMSNLASGGGTGGDSGGNNGQGQNKGEQQQGSYTAPKSEGRIMLDLTQQRNWQKTLAVRALQIAQGKGEARMQLHPAEMGALIVRVQVRDGATRINVVAEKEEATKLLNENRHILEQSFKEQGMDFQEFNLSQGNASDFGGDKGDDDKDDKASFAQNLKDKTEENQANEDEKPIIKTDRLVDTMV